MKLKLAAAVIAAIVLLPSCNKDDITAQKQYSVGQKNVVDVSFNSLMDIVQSTLPDYVCTKDAILKIAEAMGYDKQVIEDLLTAKKTKNAASEMDWIGTTEMDYLSVDCQGKTETISGRLYYPCDDEGNIITPDHVVLACHHTSTMNKQVPSAGLSLEILPALRGALVIAPDYLGFGTSSSRAHPYCISDITGRNCADMMLAAFEYLKYDEGIDCAGLPLYIEGYSQGGHATLSTVKYFQESGLADIYPIENAYCGGGPYSQTAIMKDYLETNYCYYAIAAPYVILGYKEAFPEIMTESLDKYFTEAFNKSGLIDDIRSKSKDAKTINTAIRKALEPELTTDDLGVHVDKVLSKDAVTAGTKINGQLMQCAAKCEIASGWAPGYPVHFMHNDKDEIVKYVNFEAAREGLKNDRTYFETVSYEGIDGHVLNGVIFYLRILFGEYMKVYPGGETVTE